MSTTITVQPTQYTVAATAAGYDIVSAGAQGPTGQGVPAGGTTGQALVKASDTAFDTQWATVTGAGGGSGTVTSVAVAAPSLFDVAGSPVSTAGTITLTLANQTANTVLAGPTFGAAAAPTMRALVAADLPASGVAAGDYTSADITVDQYGRVTAAASGTPGGVTSFNARTGAVILAASDVTAALGYADISRTSQSQTWTGTPTFSNGVVTSVFRSLSGEIDFVPAAGFRTLFQDASGAGGVYFVHNTSLAALVAQPISQSVPPEFLIWGASAAAPFLDGGPLVLQPGAKRGGGSDGSVVIRAQTAGPSDLLQVQDSAKVKHVWVDSSFVLHGDGSGLSNVPYPVVSVNTKTGAVTLSASDVGAQPASANLTTLAGVTPTTAGTTLLAAADAAAQRTDLGLGSLATKSTVTLATDVTGVLPSGNLPATVVYGDTADLPHRVGWVLARGTPATTGPNKAGVKVRLPYAGTFKKVWVDAETGPTGADLILDIKLNGASLWSVTPANRPKITAGATSGTQTAFDTASFAAGDYLTIDIAQVGSTVAGQDVAVALDMQTRNQ